MSARRVMLAALLGLFGAGCAAAQTFVMAPGEYGVYRRTRAGRTLEDRLTASYDYITKYPEGARAEEVRTDFLRAEGAYFARAKLSVKGLEAYLLALPKGPHSAEAYVALRDLRLYAEAQRSGITGAAKATDTEVRREAERRKAVRERLEQWIGLFLDPAVYKAPMADSKASLIVPWSLSLPWPVCERAGSSPEVPSPPPGGARRCTKLLQFDYRAVDKGAAEERQALVEIAIWQDEDGRPVEVTLAGPELFLSLAETVTARTAARDDPDARLEGAERAVDIGQAAWNAQVGADAACKKPSDTDVLRLACKGVELRVLAGALDGEDDRFVIRPLP